ncbi:LysE family transporter [Candidatus Pseudothioglobus singularis]|nr:LysE family transporter [Candidatus Pseudothioglobus singularis]
MIAIGAQNAFVLRQGILRQHVFYIALFCSIADSFLIILGIAGISYFLNDFINEYSKVIFGIASLWLFIYGVLRLRSAFKSNLIILTNKESSSLANAISIISIFTFANPHVYLDTMILIGSISQQFLGLNRVYFAIGACFASFFWFFGIAYGAKLLNPIIQTPRHWRILDLLIALIMFSVGFNLLFQGGWI